MRCCGEEAERNEECQKECSTERIGWVVKEEQRKKELSKTKGNLIMKDVGSSFDDVGGESDV